MLFNRLHLLWSTPVLLLISMLFWGIGWLANYSDLVATHWHALGAKLAMWQWVALCCGIWALLVLMLMSSVGKYRKLLNLWGVVLFAFHAQKTFIGNVDEGTSDMLVFVLLVAYVFGGGYIIHAMYSIEYNILRRRPVGKNSFPTLKIKIHHHLPYDIAEKTIFLLLSINLVLLGFYYMDLAQPTWHTVSCVVLGLMGVVWCSAQRFRLIQAWQLVKNHRDGWVFLNEEGIEWCFDVIELSSGFLWGAKHQPVCHRYENFIAWEDVQNVGFIETPTPPKQQKKLLEFPEYVLIVSRPLPPTDNQIQLLIPYIRTEYFFDDLLRILQRTTAVGKTYQSTKSS